MEWTDFRRRRHAERLANAASAARSRRAGPRTSRSRRAATSPRRTGGLPPREPDPPSRAGQPPATTLPRRERRRRSTPSPPGPGPPGGASRRSTVQPEAGKHFHVTLSNRPGSRRAALDQAVSEQSASPSEAPLNGVPPSSRHIIDNLSIIQSERVFFFVFSGKSRARGRGRAVIQRATGPAWRCCRAGDTQDAPAVSKRSTGFGGSAKFAQIRHQPRSGPGAPRWGVQRGLCCFFGPLARRRPGRREMSEGVRVQTRTTCRMPPHLDTRGWQSERCGLRESSTRVPQRGRALCTTVPHGSASGGKGVRPLTPAAVARWV